jgi:hypothetical protein
VGLLASVRTGAGGQFAAAVGAALTAGQVGHLAIGPLAPADYEAVIRRTG